MHFVQLLSPFPGRINPLAEQADFYTAEWLGRFSLIRSHDELRHSQNGRFTWMVARMFPGANLNALGISADLNALLFLIDDHFDGAGGEAAKAPLFKGFIHRMIEILSETEDDGHKEKNNVLAAFRDIWLRLVAISTPAWQQRFRESLVAALNANLWRMETLDNDQPVALADYLHYRPMIGGANFFTYLAEVMEGVVLPEHCFEHPHITRMMDLCAGSICWANDLFSFRKELAEGDTMNLVMLLQQERGGTLSHAIKSAKQIHDRAVKEFIELAWNPPVFGDEQTDALVKRFVQSLGVMMKGNIDWSTLDTLRYRQLQPEAASKAVLNH